MLRIGAGYFGFEVLKQGASWKDTDKVSDDV